MTQVHFIVPGDPNQCTGGYLYDARIVQGLRHLGWAVSVTGLAGHFPEPDEPAARAMDQALARIAPTDLAVIDGLALGGLPEVLRHHARRLRVLALVHHPLADEYGLSADRAEALRAREQRTLHLVRQVVATSAFTARHLVADYAIPVDRVSVVEPGVDRTLAQGAQGFASGEQEDPPRLLCVASLVPRKGHQVLVEALSCLKDLAWECDCVGDPLRDPSCARDIRRAIEHHRLADRVHLRGALPQTALAALYQRSQVFVLPSWYEGYGMVVAEALMHGLPVVATSGGALAETVPEEASLQVAPGDAGALAQALRRVMVDHSLCATLGAGARRAAAALPGWLDQAARFAAILAELDRREHSA